MRTANRENEHKLTSQYFVIQFHKTQRHYFIGSSHCPPYSFYATTYISSHNITDSLTFVCELYTYKLIQGLLYDQELILSIFCQNDDHNIIKKEPPTRLLLFLSMFTSNGVLYACSAEKIGPIWQCEDLT